MVANEMKGLAGATGEIAAQVAEIQTMTGRPLDALMDERLAGS